MGLVDWKKRQKLGITFPKSLVDSFRHTNKNLRYGQAFHQHAKLEKIKGRDKEFCDLLYFASDEQAKRLIAEKTDHSN